MIQNVLLTSFTPLNTKNEINCWDNRPFSTVWPENVQQKQKDITRTIKKKPKRVRTAFSTDQLRVLENAYSHHKYIGAEKRAELSNILKIGDKCIKIWFQNRRMREKRESYEFSYDSSSESVSNESTSVPASPPLQVIINEPTPGQVPQYPDNTYQLPTYYNTTEVQSMYGGMAPPNFARYFYNENTVYPTQYYPFEINYSNGGSGYNQYGSEINNCWTGNQYSYYTNI